jgi:hypothetical protein
MEAVYQLSKTIGLDPRVYSEMKKFLMPIIVTKEQQREAAMAKGADPDIVSEHQKTTKVMSVEELEENRVLYFDRWCWDTNDPTDRALFVLYESQLKIRNMINDLMSVQPMGGPVAPVGTLNYRYGNTTPEE